VTPELSGAFPGKLEPGPSGGWRVVIPVRAEHVSVEKRTVVYEEVDIRRELVEDTASISQPVGHEELEVRGTGDVVTERLPAERWTSSGK